MGRKSATKIYSKHDGRKSVVAERVIKTFKQ